MVCVNLLMVKHFNKTLISLITRHVQTFIKTKSLYTAGDIRKIDVNARAKLSHFAIYFIVLHYSKVKSGFIMLSLNHNKMYKPDPLMSNLVRFLNRANYSN